MARMTQLLAVILAALLAMMLLGGTNDAIQAAGWLTR